MILIAHKFDARELMAMDSPLLGYLDLYLEGQPNRPP
jgi:hypothetical protein